MSDKVLKLIEDVKALTVLELSELVKALEEEFGVSAAGRGRCRCRSRCCRCGREDRVRRDPGGSRR